MNERVMAFANSVAYGGQLTMLPSASTEQVLSLRVVEGTAMLVAGQSAVESTDAEVEQVVQLVIDHARTRPQESLGVIALTRVHAARIEAAVRLELSRHPRMAAFVAADRPDAFIVKAAEHASGDTRDAIILAVGFGRTPHGRVLHRFGALSRDGGERLLTAATTRARRRLTVVAAFEAGDLDPDRLTTPGARMLRDLLQQVASDGEAAPRTPGEAPGTPDETPGTPDLLLADLAVRLRAEHLDVREHHGTSGHPIDVAVADESGAWRVAVESDGPSYADASARERDRIRPAELAKRGWRHERVWSTDLFRDPAREVARVRAAARGGQHTPHTGAHRNEAPPAARPGPSVRWDSEGAGREQPAGTRPGPGTSASPWTAVAPQRRGRRPRVPTGRPVEDYRDDELDAVVAWICSDTLLRTREQLAALVRQQLGLVRRSSRVDTAVASAITRVVARGDARTSDVPGASAGPSPAEAGRRRAGDRVNPHDPHERWLLDQRPPHWD
jgi:very-short-patch-repair endonuclease